MTLRWYTVVVDCRDVHAQAHWWAQTLGWPVVFEADDEAVIVPPAIAENPGAQTLQDWLALGQGMVFVPVPESKTIKNRLHIDLAPHTSQDRAAEIADLESRGARRVDVGQTREETWTVLADPEGNEFCVLSSRNR
ncbi:MAG: VOC family protein [Nostocoides sp.]